MSESDRRRAAGSGDARVGDAVIAEDGELGHIETVVRSEVKVPLFMVIATGRFRRRRPVLSCALVENVDRANRRVHVRGSRSRLRHLPESAPIAF
jgi:hypothetical protein